MTEPQRIIATFSDDELVLYFALFGEYPAGVGPVRCAKAGWSVVHVLFKPFDTAAPKRIVRAMNENRARLLPIYAAEGWVRHRRTNARAKVKRKGKVAA